MQGNAVEEFYIRCFLQSSGMVAFESPLKNRYPVLQPLRDLGGRWITPGCSQETMGTGMATRYPEIKNP